MSSKTDFSGMQKLKVEEIEKILQQYLPKQQGYQKLIMEAMTYSLLAGGKRLRPMLMQETYRLFDGDSKAIHPFMAAIEMIHYCAEMGYETTINIMAVSTAAESELDLALDLLAQSEVGTIYLVDSYGSLYPEQIRRLADKYLKVAEKYGKKVGIHAHNNQQLAFANTIEACTVGVSYLDATMSGMGRGAGNCNMELLLGFLRNPKYSLNPVLKFLQNQMLPLKKTGLVWGCDVQYMLTGQQNQHPRTAIAFTAEQREDYAAFYQSLLDRE